HRANQHGAKPGKCSWKDDFAELTLTHEIVGEAVGRVAASQPHAVANGALRVGVYHQRFQAAARECCGKVYGCSGLSNATLLAYDGDNVPHAHRPPRGEVLPSPPGPKLSVRCPGLGAPSPADSGPLPGSSRSGSPAASTGSSTRALSASMTELPDSMPSRVALACLIHRSDSGPLGGRARKSVRCWRASSGSPLLIRRMASP